MTWADAGGIVYGIEKPCLPWKGEAQEISSRAKLVNLGSTKCSSDICSAHQVSVFV